MTSIGFIEDDEAIRRHVTKRLGGSGYSVQGYGSADGAWEDFLQHPKDLYVVDRMVPGRLSGLELCQLMRAQMPALPILILSALSEGGDRIDGLRAGADDYLTKPFEMEELCLRIESLLKRARRTTGGGFSWDGRTMDFERFQLRVGSKLFAIPRRECELFRLLVEREGKVVTRDEILDRLWGNSLFPSSRTVDNFIVRLRRLLEPDPSNPKYIQSVRGMGYKFTTS